MSLQVFSLIIAVATLIGNIIVFVIAVKNYRTISKKNEKQEFNTFR